MTWEFEPTTEHEEMTEGDLEDIHLVAGMLLDVYGRPVEFQGGPVDGDKDRLKGELQDYLRLLPNGYAGILLKSRDGNISLAYVSDKLYNKNEAKTLIM